MQLNKFLRKIDENGEKYLLLPLYTMIVMTIFMEVIRRSILSYSSIWAEEIARYAFVYVAWIGASAAIKDRAHIRIDILLPFFPKRICGFIFFFGDFLTLVLAIFSIYWSMDLVFNSIRFGSVTHGLRISQAWFMGSIPLGFSMMVFRLIQSMRRDWKDIMADKSVFKGNKLFD